MSCAIQQDAPFSAVVATRTPGSTPSGAQDFLSLQKSSVVKGDAFMDQIAHPAPTFLAHMRWYDEREDYDSDEDEEGETEKLNISEIFGVISTDGGISIAAAQFGDLVKELGISHTAEEHLAAVEQLKDAEGRISRDSLHKWYFSWLFCDKEEDDSDDNGAASKALLGLKRVSDFGEVKESPKPDVTTSFDSGTVPSGGFTFGAPISACKYPFTVGATGGNALACTYETAPPAANDPPVAFKFGSANVSNEE
jgi:hypothetical protein